MQIADDTEAIRRRYREAIPAEFGATITREGRARGEIGRRDDAPLRPAYR